MLLSQFGRFILESMESEMHVKTVKLPVVELKLTVSLVPSGSLIKFYGILFDGSQRMEKVWSFQAPHTEVNHSTVVVENSIFFYYYDYLNDVDCNNVTVQTDILCTLISERKVFWKKWNVSVRSGQWFFLVWCNFYSLAGFAPQRV